MKEIINRYRCHELTLVIFFLFIGIIIMSLQHKVDNKISLDLYNKIQYSNASQYPEKAKELIFQLNMYGRTNILEYDTFYMDLDSFDMDWLDEKPHCSSQCIRNFYNSVSYLPEWTLKIFDKYSVANGENLSAKFSVAIPEILEQLEARQHNLFKHKLKDKTKVALDFTSKQKTYLQIYTCSDLKDLFRELRYSLIQKIHSLNYLITKISMREGILFIKIKN